VDAALAVAGESKDLVREVDIAEEARESSHGPDGQARTGTEPGQLPPDPRLHTDVYGLSTQDADYQLEAAARLHLPYALLSDAELRFTAALRLPTLTVDGMTLLRRLTLVIKDGCVEHVLYPVFPPDRAATDVLAVLLR
jgi:hypothetical protein